MKRLVVIFVAFAIALAIVASATAHPLGNFTVNRYGRIEPSGARLYVLYVLDMAEIPTFQARAEVQSKGEAAYGDALARSIARHVDVTVGGRRSYAYAPRHVLAFPPGQAGLRTTRLEVLLASPPVSAATHGSSYRDRNYAGPDRVEGDRRPAGLSGTSPASSSAPVELGLPRAPLLSQEPAPEPAGRDRGDRAAAAGDRRRIAPAADPKDVLEQRVGVRAVSDGGFASLITRDQLSVGVILISLAVALFWGAAHALSPGHGKSIVAAYLVGQRGTPRHAVLLGLVVTSRTPSASSR